MGRPVTTLFMLMSVDGKISTGATDELDFDKDLPQIEGAQEGLPQYYDIEQMTDLWSLNSGRVQAKLGVNEKAAPAKTPVSVPFQQLLSQGGLSCVRRAGNQDDHGFRSRGFFTLYHGQPV